MRSAISEDLDRLTKGERPLTPEGRKAAALNPEVLH